MSKSIVIASLLVIVGAEYQSYRPRGWRPAGRPFEPAARISGERSQIHVDPSSSMSHGYPSGGPSHEQLPTTERVEATVTTTERFESSIRTTTTPRSREPTTSHDRDEQDYDTSPALAIANSFAFNRPVYIYNTFPFHSGLTFVK